MSVLIKGMQMPYGCANCNFVGSPIYDSKGRAIYNCNVPVDGISGKDVTEQVIDMYKGGGGDYFPDWCPLVEIPNKHGDLIDRDACIDYCRDNDKRSWEALAYAEAVIEAEGK